MSTLIDFCKNGGTFRLEARDREFKNQTNTIEFIAYLRVDILYKGTSIAWMNGQLKRLITSNQIIPDFGNSNDFRNPNSGLGAEIAEYISPHLCMEFWKAAKIKADKERSVEFTGNGQITKRPAVSREFTINAQGKLELIKEHERAAKIAQDLNLSDKDIEKEIENGSEGLEFNRAA
jgi:hypothetical protein